MNAFSSVIWSRLDCTLPVSTDVDFSFIGELASKYMFILLMHLT